MPVRICLALLIVASSAAIAAGSAPARPRILGISHAAFYVSDTARARAFYKDFLGFAEPYALPRPHGGELVWIKVNDRQSIELFPGSEAAPGSDRLFHIALETDDAEAMRVYLQAHGVTVPPVTPVGRIGNRNFTVQDPAGNRVEFVEYRPEGWTRREAGRHLPDTRISHRILHVGVMTGPLDASLAFYRDLLGFQEFWRGSAGGRVLNWVNVRVPDGDDYLELMLYEAPPDAERLRIMHHICLEVADVPRAAEILAGRPRPAGIREPSEVRTGVNRRRQVNYYDPDGTRIEIMEPRTVDGVPPPSSPAPAPAVAPR